MFLVLVSVEVPEAKATVAELITYPVKACAGVPLGEAMLTEAGLVHDRTFMVVDAEGAFLGQRHAPLLAVVQPAVSSDGLLLTLRAPGAEDLQLEVDLRAARREVVLARNRYRGIDQGDAAARWLSSLLGRPARLMRVPPEHRRVTGGWTPGTSAYADAGPVHAISRATLRDLNRRLGENAIPMSRFRPNLVIDGWETPHTEDTVRYLRVGGADLCYAELAIRCAVTMIDQGSGVKAGPEPLRTLAGYRRAAGGGVAFGVRFSVLRAGKLAVGDEVVMLSIADS